MLSLVLMLSAPPLPAQSGARPERPRLPRGADTADAMVYRMLGIEQLRRDPAQARAAFYWAGRLDPETAEYPYAQYVATLLDDQSLLRLFMRERGRRDRRLAAHDTLLDRAHRLSPFFHPFLDAQLINEWAIREAGASLRRRGLSQVRDDDPALEFEVTTLLQREPWFRPVLDLSRGNFAAALRGWAMVIELHPRLAEPRIERARAFYLAGQPDSAHAELVVALRMLRGSDADTIRLYYQNRSGWEYATGLIFEALQQPDSAVAAYQRCLTENLAYYPAHLRMAAMHVARGDTAAGLLEMSRAVAVKEDEYLTRFRYGALLQAAGRNDSAEIHLRRAAELEPWAARPRLLLAVTLDATGRRRAAAAEFQAFLDRAARTDRYRPGVEVLLQRWRANGL